MSTSSDRVSETSSNVSDSDSTEYIPKTILERGSNKRKKQTKKYIPNRQRTQSGHYLNQSQNFTVVNFKNRKMAGHFPIEKIIRIIKRDGETYCLVEWANSLVPIKMSMHLIYSRNFTANLKKLDLQGFFRFEILVLFDNIDYLHLVY